MVKRYQNEYEIPFAGEKSFSEMRSNMDAIPMLFKLHRDDSLFINQQEFKFVFCKNYKIVSIVFKDEILKIEFEFDADLELIQWRWIRTDWEPCVGGGEIPKTHHYIADNWFDSKGKNRTMASSRRIH